MQQIDRFEVLDTLGSGTVGVVYRVRDPRDGGEYALKMLLPTVSENEQVASRFAREIRVLQRLRHPHIVEYHADGRQGKQLYYVMELIELGTMKQVLERQERLPWRQAAQCGWQAASALQYAHNHGVIHRDLKPSNLFLKADGAIKLGDFGIALDTYDADLTVGGLTVGTYAYMSPEQIRGQRDASGKCDLYSLGCILFELLSGRPPFVGDNFAQIFEQHLNSQPADVRDYTAEAPEALAELIQHLLQKKIEDRPFNAREVQGRLAALLLDDESQGTESSVSPPQRKTRDPEFALLDVSSLGVMNREAPQTPLWVFFLGALLIVGLIAVAKLL